MGFAHDPRCGMKIKTFNFGLHGHADTGLLQMMKYELSHLTA